MNKNLDKFKLNIPEAWDKNFREKLEKDIHRYLEQFFYDGPFDESILMAEIMREARGQINPHIAQKVIREFLEDKPV